MSKTVTSLLLRNGLAVVSVAVAVGVALASPALRCAARAWRATRGERP